MNLRTLYPTRQNSDNFFYRSSPYDKKTTTDDLLTPSVGNPALVLSRSRYTQARNHERSAKNSVLTLASARLLSWHTF